MTGAGETYRRLPGRRRGIVGSAGMWMGPDHLLLVKSAWFREEYKRFYLRDIQAIVVAPCARFHVSMPVLIFALCWLLPAVTILFWPAGVAVVWGIGGLAMAATWLSLSLASSCRCRLYTAVSNDELPSLYRTWTARKFLNEVRPRIDGVQGAMQPGWLQAEHAGIGVAATAGPAAVTAAPAVRLDAHSHSLAADLFVLSLFVSAAVDFGTVHLTAPIWARVNTGLALAQLVGAIAVLAQHYRGRLRGGIQKIAIAALALTGVMFYVQSISVAFARTAAAIAGNAKTLPLPVPFVVTHQIADGLEVLLGLIGAVLILRGSLRGEPDIIKD